MFNIDEFSAAVSDRGILRTNKFSLLFPLPNGFLSDTFAGDASGYYWSVIRDLPMWCTSAQLPAMSAQIDQIRRFGYGPMSKVPIAPVYEDILINVRCDAQAAMWNFFYAWKELTIATNASKGIGGMGDAPEFPYDPYETGYRDDYAVNFTFTSYNDAGFPVHNLVLRDAYPVDVGSIKFDWEDKNRIASFPVLITYQDWYPEMTADKAPVNNDGTIPNALPPDAQIAITPPIQQVFNTTSTRTIS